MNNLKPSQIAAAIGLVLSAGGSIAMGVSAIMRNQEANEQLIKQTQETLEKIFNAQIEGVQIQEF